jgi:cobalt-zinc-cadmium efflux system protein
MKSQLMHMHDHEHAHQHGHVHATANFGRVFAIAVFLNIALVFLQFAYGILGNSMALIADAGHNLTDVLGLLMAWGANATSRIPPTLRYTYGFRSSSILAALGNAIVLLIAVGAIAWEAGQRLANPQPVSETIVIMVAAVGLVINGGTALLFMAGRKRDLNIRGAFVHMAADAGISLGVILSGVMILCTGWLWLDPLTSLVISLIIVWGTWGMLRDALNLALNAVPVGINAVEVRDYLQGLSGVESIHDLHIWAMSTTQTALTCHLVMPAGHPPDTFVVEVTQQLHDRFAIEHATLQIERGDAICALKPDHVV